MHSETVLMFSASLLLAQAFRQALPQTPLQSALQAYQSAHQSGRSDDAAAAREQARHLLAFCRRTIRHLRAWYKMSRKSTRPGCRLRLARL